MWLTAQPGLAVGIGVRGVTGAGCGAFTAWFDLAGDFSVNQTATCDAPQMWAADVTEQGLGTAAKTKGSGWLVHDFSPCVIVCILGPNAVNDFLVTM